MHKLIVLIQQPEDMGSFEARWSEDFVGKAESMPGLRRVAVSRVSGGPTGGGDLHMIHEFFFDDAKSLRQAMASKEGQAAGKALMAFAADYATLCFAEHFEEDLENRIDVVAP